MSVPALFKPPRLRKMLMDWEGRYDRRNENLDLYARWYFKQHGSLDDWEGRYDRGVNRVREGLDDPFTPVNLPTHMVNMALSMFLQETPAIEVLVNQTKKQEVKRGNLAEKVFMGVLYMNGEVQEKELLAEYYLNLLLFGWGVTYTVWDPTRVPERLKPALQREAEKLLAADLGSPDARRVEKDNSKEEDSRDLPTVVEVPHPREIYAVPGGGARGRWRCIFRRTDEVLWEAEDRYGVELPRTTQADSIERQLEDEAEIQVYDIWAWVGKQVWHCILVDGLPKWQLDSSTGAWSVDPLERAYDFIKDPVHMPEYDRLPYDIRFCIPTSDPRPEHYGLGLLYTVLDSVAAAERLLSRQELIVDNFADPIRLAKYNTDLSSAAVPPLVENTPGAVINIDEGQGQGVEILQWHGTPPDVVSMIERWEKYALMMGFDSQVEGNTGLDSIVKKSGILAKLTIPIKMAESGLAATHARVVHLITELVKGEKLTIQGQITIDSKSEAFSEQVSGTQLKGMDRAVVRIRARFPYEELQNVASAQQATAGDKPLISMHRARSQYMMLQDPEAEAAKIEQETAEDPKLWIPQLIEQALAQLQMQQQMAMQQMMQMMQPQAPMAAPPDQMPMDQAQTAMVDGLRQGGMTDQQMGLVDLQGQPLSSTGNAPGAPPPNTSVQQQMGQQLPGRPPGT